MSIQGEGSAFELVRCDDEAAWLEQRKRGVGGSDVAAIMGLSPYKGAYALWCEKTGQVDAPDISDKPAVHWGTVLEPVIGEEYKAAHPDREVRRVNAVARSIARPWAQASLDYEVRDPELGWGVLEVKTAGLMRAGDWDEGVPLYYLTQVTHYLSVMQRPFCDVAVLIGGQDYREYRVMRDDEDEKAVMDAVDAFWADYVVGGQMPPITGASGDAEAVSQANRPDNGQFEWYPDDNDVLEEYRAASAAKKKAEERLKDASNALKQLIGQSKGIETESGKFTWTRTTASKLDTKKLTQEHPDLVASYTSQVERDMGIRYTEKKGN